MLKLLLKDGSGQSYAITRTNTRIGRDPSNDIVLHGDDISGFHANLIYENGVLEVVDLGSTNGTRINGKPISGKERLDAWQELEVGGVRFELTDSEARRPTVVQKALDKTAVHSAAKTQVRPSANPGTGAWLFLQSGPDGTPGKIEVTGQLTVGRDPSNDVVLNSSMISSRHAVLAMRVGGLTVTDLGSTNGTRVNGRKVSKESLSDGDTVSFDDVSFSVALNGATAPRTRVNPKFESRPAQASATQVTGGLPRGAPATEKPAERPQDWTPGSQAEDPAPGFERPLTGNADHNSGLLWLLFSPSGRLPRLPYFVTNVCLFLFSFLSTMVLFAMSGIAIGSANIPSMVASLGFVLVLYSIMTLALAYSGAVVFIKRLHDLGWSGWLFLINIVVNLVFLVFNPATVGPLVLILFLVVGLPYLVFVLVVLFKRGTDGPNRYGVVRNRVL